MARARRSGIPEWQFRLAPHVFTPARIAVLDLLASQAAISLENARLYTELERENLERQRVEDELRRSESLMAEGQRIRYGQLWATANEGPGAGFHFTLLNDPYPSDGH
jgi:GAF domain-containing protein